MIEIIGLLKDSFSNKRLKRIEDYCKKSNMNIFCASSDNYGYIFIHDYNPTIYSYLLEMCQEKDKNGNYYMDCHQFNSSTTDDIKRKLPILNLTSYKNFLKERKSVRFLFCKI